MKPGDLVRWRGPIKEDEGSSIGSAGIVVEMSSYSSFESGVSVLWEDGAIYHGVIMRWLEVLNEAR